ncbi:MAG: uncharacterized protein K0S45_1480 [Nitrospira sp.]|nr:uncharacterized protein [Nitrospira sp.]
MKTRECLSGLSAAALIEIWEQGAGRHSIDQALLVLRYACPERSFDDLCDWTVGQRDARLLEVRRDTFGDRIDCYAECPACRNGLEFELSCESLLAHRSADGTTGKTVDYAGSTWELRALNSRDLSVAATAPDARTAREAMLARCVTKRTDRAVSPVTWTDALQEALAAGLALMEPLAELLIGLACQACGHVWQSLFDIAAFLWREIVVRSRRLLQEVDVLARAYGWTESDILRMTDQRRRLYVEMALS